jgi:HEXXH motif-containing protein
MQQTQAEQDIYRGFSCPYQPFDQRFFSLLVAQYSRSLIELFLDRFEQRLDQTGNGVTEMLSSIHASETRNDEIFWSTVPALMMESLTDGDALSAQRAAASFLLHCGAHGVSGDWELHFDQPSLFLWGSYLLPETERLIVNHKQDTVRILSEINGSRHESRLHRVAETGAWRSEELTPLPLVADDGYAVTLLPDQVAPPLECTSPTLSEISSATNESIAQSLGLLRALAPRYRDWVTRVLRRLIVVAAPQTGIMSGNLHGYYSMFYISDCRVPLVIGEMLIHEASHQYFHSITALEDVADQSDPTTYYSPFVGRPRTIDRLLLAYHAFGNVYLYYRECLASQVHHERAKTELRTVYNDLNVVEDTLMTSDKLTPTGRALIEPLYREIHRGN